MGYLPTINDIPLYLDMNVEEKENIYNVSKPIDPKDYGISIT